MTSDTARRRRLLVALDNAGPCDGAMRTLARLLAATPLEITGLFLEDEDLLRAAALPGMQEITLGGQAASLNAERISRDMAGAAAAARRAFDALTRHLASEHGRLEYRFQVARGHISEELDRAAAGQDVVVVTRAWRTAGLRSRLGRTYSALARQPLSVLLINEPWASGSSVVVLDGDSATIAYAARLAQLEGVRLVVAQPPDARNPKLQDGAEVRPLADLKEATLADLCLVEDARLLVLPPLADADWTELLVSLIDKLPCSLLKLAPAVPPRPAAYDIEAGGS
jgi:nucleotide-binding universal stress UspA family protein